MQTEQWLCFETMVAETLNTDSLVWSLQELGVKDSPPTLNRNTESSVGKLCSNSVSALLSQKAAPV